MISRHASARAARSGVGWDKAAPAAGPPGGAVRGGPALAPLASLTLLGTLIGGLLPKPVAGAGDEHVFERRLAQTNGSDPAGKGLHQPRNPLVPIGRFQADGLIDDLRRQVELLTDFVGQGGGLGRFN